MEEAIPQGPTNKIKKFLKPRNFIFLILIIGILFLGFYFWQKTKIERPRLAFARGYRLVEEKISQSAAIKIYLPPGVEEGEAKANIKFEPEIEGKWLEQKKEAKSFFSKMLASLQEAIDGEKEEKVVIFKPKEKLRLNRYYSVQLALADGSLLKSDFLAVEDPKIVAIFPQANSETNEKSEITIVFNRPMVPLSALGYLEEKEVPVEIYPKTEGRFKWISTQNLQFIPKERLQRSSHYRVKIKSGLVSMDGLEVEGREIEFITRPLRYLDEITSGQIIYNQPISIYFNQPVNLERTKREITLKNITLNREIDFIAEYGKKKIDGREEIDQSIIQVYQAKDKFGRPKLWDFKNSYQLEIRRAYPAEGDIILEEGRATEVNVTNVIESLGAESERTNLVEPDFFDPKGKLWVSFYEEIDLGKSKISAPKLKEINYGQKCQEENLPESECQKIPDKKKIYLTFKSEEIGLGERLEVKFEKIVNLEGLKINPEPISKTIISYPQFKILKTWPENNSLGAKVNEFIFCSNSPILTPAREDYEKYLKANLPFEIENWGDSWRVTAEYKLWHKDEICEVGQFHTEISYGLMPLSDYYLEFHLEDVFGQKLDFALGFRTGEMPSRYLRFYHFQNQYNVTSPAKTTLAYAVENIEYLDLEICKLSPFDFLYYLENQPQWYSKIPDFKCQKLIKDKIELPPRYWIKNYFKIDLKDYFENPLGNYLITLSNPNYTWDYWEERVKTKRQVFEKTFLNVTNLSVVEKKISPRKENYYGEKILGPSELKDLKNLYWVNDLTNLEPVFGAKISFYQTENLNFANSFTTNFQGIAETPVFYDLRGVIVEKGEDATVLLSGQSQLEWATSAYLAQKIYLYTDKPIYRPSQEVFIKGIYRQGYDGNYEIGLEKINLKVYNSRDDEVFNQDLKINDFGTFNTKIVLPKDAPLGSWRICAEKYNCYYFEVQEYLPAAFEVNLTTDKEEYISKDKFHLKVQANYYFDVPLEGGEVSYTISSQNYYFDKYQDEYFRFGGDWYWWPDDYGDKFILRGKTNLNERGEAEISQELDFEKFFKEKERKSKIFVVDVTIKNPQGQTVSGQKSFIVHAGEFYLGVKPDRYFLTKNEEFNIKVKSVDWQGKEQRVKNGELKIYKIDWIWVRRQEADGRYYYHWEEKKDLIESFKFDTDEKGNFSQKLKIAQEGSYQAEVSARDRRGNLVFSSYDFYVGGPGRVSIRPSEDIQLELVSEKRNLKVGEEGKVIIKSPYSQAKALITIERGKIFDYQIRKINQNLYQYNFETKLEYIPNIFLSVTLISSEPGVKFGQLEFNINTQEKELKIDVQSNKKYYLPGEKVVLDITTKDFKDQPVSTEVSVAVVDLSVLALKGNPKKNPVIFFYSGFPLAVATASNLKNVLIEAEIPQALLEAEGKGGAGGGMVEDLAKKRRGIFKETAFWEAQIRTDSSGKAKVEFTLPDNLTTWQTETLGVTKDTKLGIHYLEFLTKKELMVTPLKPRFIVPGDSFSIGAKVFNQSKESQKIFLKFESQTLKLDDSPERTLTLNPGETKTIYFKVIAPPDYEKEEHYFLISAKTNGLEDTVEQSIKITKNQTYEITATSNYTQAKETKEYVFLPENIVKDRGELTIKSSATLAVFLSDALNYLLQFPYGCAEQIASKLNAIAIVKKGLNLPNLADKFKLEKIKDEEGKEYTIDEVVEIGLAKLYNYQNPDGGFGFWHQGKSSFYATLHVVDALNNLSQAGYEINKNSLARAADFLYQKITTDWQLYQDKNNVILTAYILFNLPDFKKDGALRGQIIKIAKDDLFINEQISNSSLSYLAILLSKGNFDKNLKNKIFQILENRIDIDSRGAFLEPNKNFLWYYYETPIKDTALLLKALSVEKREIAVLDKIVRWLLNSRANDGAWGSTNNTSSVIEAFIDFLKWKRETESDFIFNLLVNEKKEGSFHFNKETILDQFKKEIPLSDLKFNQINTISFLKENLNNLANNLYYDMALKYYLPAEKIPPRDEGFTIERGIYALEDKENKNPLKKARVGDVLRVHLKITVPEVRNFVMVEDFIPAGMEIINLDLETEQKSLLLEERARYWRDYDYYYWRYENRSFWPDFKELHDDRAFLFRENLDPGVYEFEYYVRALIKGKFIHLPAIVSEMYFPEIFGRTSAGYFEIE